LGENAEKVGLEGIEGLEGLGQWVVVGFEGKREGGLVELRGLREDLVGGRRRSLGLGLEEEVAGLEVPRYVFIVGYLATSSSPSDTPGSAPSPSSSSSPLTFG
jgi:hypothetical protein